MSTTSSRRILGIAFGGCLLAACLPGPWDYVPESFPAFRGITVQAYAVADRPVENFCFERVFSLDEASAEGFAFYDSAAVGIAGVFSNGSQTLALTPDANVPNCFRGPAGTRFVRGESYALTARFVWDSARVRTATTLTSTARIPSLFAIEDSAHAPSLVTAGLALDNVTDPDVFLQLPPRPRALFLERYGDTLTALDGDSAGLAQWEKANGPRMRAELLAWLQGDLVTYGRGDSVYYINASDTRLSNLSHFFKARRDGLVKGVLVSHRFDTTASRPANAFDSIAGLKPDTSDFYFAGDIRRLIFYGDYPNPDGSHIFDSMAVVNPWFWSGRNRLYFYGTEEIYSDYMAAQQEGQESSKIRLPSNVSGGRGFFTGMVVDSFDVHIKLDGATQAIPYPVSRAAACREKGWFNTRDCVGYYPEYCALNNWAPADCRIAAMQSCADPAFESGHSAVCATSDSIAAADTLLAAEALARSCIDRNYPAGCEEIKAECEDGETGNGCQLILWKHCQLNYWKGPECAEAKVSYCSIRRETHRTMCRDVPE